MSEGKKPDRPGAAPKGPTPQGVTYVQFKPRRGLLTILALLLAGWVGLLTYWYFTTVYPARHGPATQPTETRP